MLSGRWLLFFGVLWLSMNMLMSEFGPAGVGSNVPTVLDSQTPILMTTNKATTEQEPPTSAEVEQQAGLTAQRAWSWGKTIWRWATWSWPGILEGPVWGRIQLVWGAFSTLLGLQVILQVRQLIWR